MCSDACARAQGRTLLKGRGMAMDANAALWHSLHINHILKCVRICHAVIWLSFALYVHVQHERCRVFDLATHVATGWLRMHVLKGRCEL